jgi:hypothetical protein
MDRDGSFDKYRFGRYAKPLLEAHMTVPLSFGYGVVESHERPRSFDFGLAPPSIPSGD